MSPMTQKTTSPAYAESIHYDFEELLVAYDFSEAADSSLKYAVMLSKKFGSFIHLIGVQSPAEYASALEAGPLAMEMSQRDLQSGLRKWKSGFGAKGYGAIRCDGLATFPTPSKVPSSNIRPIFFCLAPLASVQLTGDVLAQPPSICCERSAARYSFWGHTPFSTIARLLLSSAFSALRAPSRSPTIFYVLPVTLQPEWERALNSSTSLMPAQKEVTSRKNHQQRCEEWSEELRERGIPVSWTVVDGRADKAIAARAAKSNSSLILFGCIAVVTRWSTVPMAW